MLVNEYQIPLIKGYKENKSRKMTAGRIKKYGSEFFFHRSEKSEDLVKPRTGIDIFIGSL